MPSHSALSTYPRAGIFRRFAALIYDALVALAVALVSGLISTVVLLIMYTQGWLTSDNSVHFNVYFQQQTRLGNIIAVIMLLTTIAFFMWFWRKGGQTIGMRAWRLRIYSMNDKPITVMRLFIRWVSTLGGLGTLLLLLDWRHKLALQDHLSQTQVLQLDKDGNDHKNW